MAYDLKLEARVDELLKKKRGVVKKRMFGGLAYMLKGKMFCGVLKDQLVLRVSKEESVTLLKVKNVKPMNFTGRVIRGFLFIQSPALRTKKSLQSWLDRGIDFVTSIK